MARRDRSDIMDEPETGIEDLARSLQRVQGVVLLGLSPENPGDEVLHRFEVTDEWRQVAATIGSIYLGSADGNVSYSAKDLAVLCRNAYYRVAEGHAPPCHFNDLSVREQLAWECVGRHAAWMVQADQDELSRLGMAELGWGDKVHQYAHNRGVTLEPAQKF